MLTDIKEIRGYTVYIKTEETAIETTPPVNEYSTAETLPAKTAPSPVRIATITNASHGEYKMSAANENMFASPILAPGKKSGGNWFSIMNAIRLNAVKIDSVAIFLAAD